MSSSRTLVTGASGFLGRHLVRALLARESPTVALCRRPENLFDRADLAASGLSIVAGDLRDVAVRARALADVDTVFHLAAVRNRPGGSVAEMASVNETATLSLARQALEAGVGRFVHVSTALVFGPSSIPLDECAPLRLDETDNAYMASKARVIPELRKLVGAGAPITTLYPTIVYGPDHPARPNRVTAQIRRLLRARIDFAIGGGHAPRDLVHVGDVVAAMLAAATSPAAAGEEFLICGEAVSQRGLGELVARSARRRRPLLVSAPVSLARPAARLIDRVLGCAPSAGWASMVGNLSRSWSFDGAKARAVLNHRPRPLAQGIEQTVEWIRRGDR